MIEQAIYDAVVAENLDLKLQVVDLNERLDKFMRLLLGQSSERFISNEALSDSTNPQLGLFGTVEVSEPEERTVPEHQRKSRQGRHPGRHPIPGHLPRRIEVLLPEGLEARTLEDGSYEVPGYQIIGIEVSERIEYIPGSLTVVQTRRPKLVKLPSNTIVPSDAEAPSEQLPRVQIVSLPPRLLSKSVADETLVVELIIRKFCEHMPLYRQAQAFQRDYGWPVSSSSLSFWVDRVAVALKPLHDELRRQIFASDLTRSRGPCPSFS